jgi:hypothetical protein
MTQAQLDEAAELTPGYTSHVEGRGKNVRSLGARSLPAYLEALGLEMLIVASGDGKVLTTEGARR